MQNKPFCLIEIFMSRKSKDIRYNKSVSLRKCTATKTECMTQFSVLGTDAITKLMAVKSNCVLLYANYATRCTKRKNFLPTED